MAEEEQQHVEEEMGEEEEVALGKPISILEGSGVTAADIKKLQEGGFQTVEAIAFATRRTLIAVKVRPFSGHLPHISLKHDLFTNFWPGFWVSFAQITPISRGRKIGKSCLEEPPFHS